MLWQGQRESENVEDARGPAANALPSAAELARSFSSLRTFCSAGILRRCSSHSSK